MRMPDHHMQPGQIGQRLGTVRQCIGAGFHERGAQQEVFGRIAAQAELRRQHEPRALRMGAARGLDDLARVARQVSDRGVDLREGDFHR